MNLLSLKKLSIPIYILILMGLILGIFWGVIASHYELDTFNFQYIAPWGEIFLRLLKMLAVPLVITSIIHGILSLNGVDKLARMASRTIFLYIITTIFAITIGLIVANWLKPGAGIELPKTSVEIKSQISEKAINSNEIQEKGPLWLIADMIPNNIFSSFTDNTLMLQVIIFSILFALTALKLPINKRKTTQSFFSESAEIFSKMINIAIKVAPIGVFSLIATAIIDFGGKTEIIISLGKYVILVLGSLFFLTFIFYPFLFFLVTGKKSISFIKGIWPAQLVAFSTSSSAATLPVTTTQVRNKLGVSEKVSGFVLPLGMTVNMDGTSLYQAISAVFLAQIYSIDLNFSDQIFIVLTALLSSIGAPGIPGGSIVMMIVVLSSINVPFEGMALILGVDRILDMSRTVTNVTGDALVSCIIDKWDIDKKI